MNQHHSKSAGLLAAALLFASLGAAGVAAPQPAARSTVGHVIADQGNAALLSIRGDLARSLKRSVTLPRLEQASELAGDPVAPPPRASLSL